MKKQYPYSNDLKFLSKINELRIKDEWVRIILLEYNSETPLENIEGQITSGSLTKTEDSAVRRTCSLSCNVDAFKYNPDDIRSKYSISKKIYLELGITNNTEDYPDEEIIWFPQGVFFITSFAISASATGSANINLQFKDKMAQLDGTIGGTLPATTRFDTITTIVNGNAVSSKALVYDIIMETVNHFGGEDLSNIIIDDIPRKAKRIIRWMGQESVWIYPIEDPDTHNISYDICFSSDLDEKRNAHTPVRTSQVIGAKEYKTNQDIGYMYEDFVYDEELTFSAGSKVTDVLDKIKNWLGNYEYFYDEQGQFHFQEIKNYLNNSQSSYIWDKMIKTDDFDYLYESTQGKAVYTFDDNINLISITNTPVYENIKNDFIVEGTTTISDIKYTCRYHLVIDDKPSITADGYNNILIYTDPITENTTIARPQIIEPQTINNEQVWLLPEFAEEGKIYGLLDEPKTFVFKQPVKDMNIFAEHYNALVNQENSFIEEDENTTVDDNLKKSILSLLEKYLSYQDDTPYKTEYRDIIFTLLRQCEKYDITITGTVPSTISEYYEDLKAKYNEDKDTSQEKLAWCGTLLELLCNIFKMSAELESNYISYKDENYWLPVDTTVLGLWQNINNNFNSEDAMRNLRKASCIQHISDNQIKQRQLGILIEQYNQIINNYNVLINLDPFSESSSVLIDSKAIVQNLISNYNNQLNLCEKRLTILYAVLTELGLSDSIIGEIYYTTDVNIPVLATSFWYYNTDDSKDNYGWNELEWDRYYNGNQSMGYVNYSNIDWDNRVFNDSDEFTNVFINSNRDKPSMNISSYWYQNGYIRYAEKYDLPYFSTTQAPENITYVSKDWRTELLLMGMRAEENGTDTGPYYQELKANLPTLYDFKEDTLKSSSISNIDYFVGNTAVIFGNDSNYGFTTEGNSAFANTLGMNEQQSIIEKANFRDDNKADFQNYKLNYDNDSYYYFFDMIDSSSSTWGEYSVKNIGRRTNVNVSDSVNCIFAPDIPNYAFINISNLTLEERNRAFTELKDVAEDIIQVTDIFHENFATGGFKHSAYEQIKYDLQQYTSYQNTISITAIPCFYLEPNVRVRINDYSTNTFGDYIVKSVSLPFGAGSNMSVTLSKAMEKM